MILGHTLFFMQYIWADTTFIYWLSRNFMWQFVYSAFYAVDSFFFLAGYTYLQRKIEIFKGFCFVIEY